MICDLISLPKLDLTYYKTRDNKSASPVDRMILILIMQVIYVFCLFGCKCFTSQSLDRDTPKALFILCFTKNGKQWIDNILLLK